MRDIKNKLTSSKNTKNIQNRKGKSFGYQVLGFGAGGVVNNFIGATGGTITTSGDYKVHIFTGPGTFCVASLAKDSSNDVVEYMVVAGGGSGSNYGGGGAGAGGWRSRACTTPTAHPLNGPAALPVSAQGYPITVGAGASSFTNGSNSVFSSITSAGGGRSGVGFGAGPNGAGVSGGSGGGGGSSSSAPRSGAAGNTPPVSPPQGNSGGDGGLPENNYSSAGGGGAGGAGANVSSPGGNGGNGGVGAYLADDFIGPTAPSYGTPGPTGSSRFFSGGGGGSSANSGAGGAAGAGGGGQGVGNTPPQPGTAGTVNTGGGGGGNAASGGGGSGIVIIRYRFQ